MSLKLDGTNTKSFVRNGDFCIKSPASLDLRGDTEEIAKSLICARLRDRFCVIGKEPLIISHFCVNQNLIIPGRGTSIQITRCLC